MKKILKRRSGEGYIDVCVLVVCAMLVLALVVRVLPGLHHQTAAGHLCGGAGARGGDRRPGWHGDHPPGGGAYRQHRA